METNQKAAPENGKYSMGTRFWSTLCHNCGVCKFANKRPESAFGKTMEWHRTWCPGWASHTKVYGEKQI